MTECREYYRTQEVDAYDINFTMTGRATANRLVLQSDRSMRESGFDSSNRFGPFSRYHSLRPICLNVLLYRMEQDTAG